MKGLGCPLAAAVGGALRICARLPALRSVYPQQADALPSDSSVSPSITLARPTMGAANSRALAASVSDAVTVTAMMRRIIRSVRLIDCSSHPDFRGRHSLSELEPRIGVTSDSEPDAATSWFAKANVVRVFRVPP